MTRLSAVTSLIVPADVVADVGCDHGLVAKFCVNSGMFKSVIASDISEKCLDKARKTLDGAEYVRFVVCDGIGYDCDEAVIAGMGGLLISDIIGRAAESGKAPKTLVLLPHRDCDAVRRRLVDCGYGIDKDFMFADGKRLYTAIRAVKGKNVRRLSDTEYMFGAFLTEKNAALAQYLQRLYVTYSRAPERNKAKLCCVRQALDAQGIK